MDFCSIPAGQPPDGVLPNFENPPSLAPAMIAVITLMSLFSVLVVAGRLYANRARLHASDYLIFIGLMLSFGISATCLMMLKFARHQWDIPACWFEASYMKIIFAVELIVPVASFFPKAAILVLYLQLFSAKTWIPYAVYFGLAFNFFTYIPLFASALYYSIPRGGLTWGELALSTTPQRGLYMSTVKAAMSVAMNIYILILPLPILLNLHLAVSKRPQLIAVFATATAGVVASIVDLVYCVELLDLEDSTWREACVSITTIFENSVAIIVGSMPAFSAFLKLHVAQSSSFQALLSRLSRKRGDASTFHSDQIASPRTFGSSEVKIHAYYELSESAVLESQCTSSREALPIMNNSNHTIMRTVDFRQQTDTKPARNLV